MPEFNATTEPKPSSLPEDLLGLLAKYDPKKDGPSEEELKDLETFQRACNYLSVAQIFVSFCFGIGSISRCTLYNDTVLNARTSFGGLQLVKAPISPEKEMTKDWVKKRLLGVSSFIDLAVEYARSIYPSTAFRNMPRPSSCFRSCQPHDPKDSRGKVHGCYRARTRRSRCSQRSLP